ncbi:MAG: hypothetical protein JXB13_17330 [Phycisphaerae bacterium]|nr:hypothetical protein [Phycisphaerae bacterium]
MRGRNLQKLTWFHIDVAGVMVCVLASLAFYAVTVQPFLQRRTAAAERRRERHGLACKASELEAALAQKQNRLEALKNELATGSVTLDSTAHINKRIAGLASFFADCELQVDDVRTGSTCRGLHCDVVPVTIVGRGSYERYGRFLHGLGAAFPDMGVVGIELTGNPARVSESETFRFELLWYAASEAQVAAAARTSFPGSFMSLP